MMKSIKIFIVCVFVAICCSLTSCSTYAYAQTLDDDISTEITYSTVVTYGTPYYVNNVVSYYVYNGLYYYPYRWHNCWYVHPFTRVQPHGYVFKPHYNFRPEHRYKRPVHFRDNVIHKSPTHFRPSSTRETVRQRTITPNRGFHNSNRSTGTTHFRGSGSHSNHNGGGHFRR